MDNLLRLESHQSLESISNCVHAAAQIGGNQDHGLRNARRPEKSKELTDLIQQRKIARCPRLRKVLSKDIQKCARRELRAWRTLWADYLLTKFRNTKFIQKINTDPIQHKSCSIPPNLFRNFLGQLFRGNSVNDDVYDIDLDDLESIPLFSMEELENGLVHLNNLRAVDECGLCAEMLKVGSDLMKRHLLESFNRILRKGEIEDSWHHTIFQMLPKDGNLDELTNWRPIAILPILYKLFARMIYTRISPRLFHTQSSDQPGEDLLR